MKKQNGYKRFDIDKSKITIDVLAVLKGLEAIRIFIEKKDFACAENGILMLIYKLRQLLEESHDGD